MTDYTLHGKNIVHMTQGSNELHFFYDAQNKPAVVVYNGSPYSYVKNLQGDIVAILNSAGTAVVQYKYDAWGKPFTPTGSMKDDLGKLNPFRYRGYTYDEETGLYYLRSRFFNSEYCRFTNADMRLGGSMNHTCHNVYTYCGNSPINYNDPDGQEAGFGALGQIGTASGSWLASGTSFSAALAAALAEPSVLGEFLLAIAVLSGMLTRSSSTTMDDVDTDTDTDSRRKNEQKTYIYRRASGTYQSMTPRPGKDSNGLSFSTIKPASGRYFRTSIESVNASGILMAVPDPQNPTHILVLPVAINTLDDWMNSRENANQNPHPYTILLMSLGE